MTHPLAMITSRLTSRCRTTVPPSVRAALHLQVGDTLQYELQGDHVVLRNASSHSPPTPFAAFSEWDSEADRKAYANL